MEELKKNKKRILKLFNMSVEIDIFRWTKYEYDSIYMSPIYESFRFYVKPKDNTIELVNTASSNKQTIEYFSMWLYFSDKQTFKSFKRIKKYFLNVEKNKKDKSLSDFIDQGATNVETVFIKEIRKKKLKKLK